MKKLICLLILVAVTYSYCSFASSNDIPQQLTNFIDTIEVNEKGIFVYIKNELISGQNGNFFKKHKLFIPKEANLAKYRFEVWPENRKFVQYAFIMYHSEGEEESWYLYLKEINNNSVVFLLDGAHSTGDGGSIPYKTEFSIQADYFQ